MFPNEQLIKYSDLVIIINFPLYSLRSVNTYYRCDRSLSKYVPKNKHVTVVVSLLASRTGTRTHQTLKFSFSWAAWISATEIILLENAK